jgi:hypothetical protein
MLTGVGSNSGHCSECDNYEGKVHSMVVSIPNFLSIVCIECERTNAVRITVNPIANSASAGIPHYAHRWQRSRDSCVAC